MRLRSKWAGALAIAVLGVLGALLFIGAAGGRFDSSTKLAPAGSPRRSIAVLGFRNLSGRPDAAWLSTAFAEMLTTELTAGAQVRAIPGENVARMKIELKLMDTDSYARDTSGRIRKNLGSDLIVVGSYLVLGPAQDQLRFDVRIQDTRGGRHHRVGQRHRQPGRSVEPRLEDRNPDADRSRHGGTVCRRLRRRARRPLPSGTEAIRLYAQGLEKYRLFDAVGSRDLLAKAVAADPSNAVAHSALAAAWAALGYNAEARNEAKRRPICRARCLPTSGSPSRRGIGRSRATRKRRFRATASCGACSRTISITASPWPAPRRRVAPRRRRWSRWPPSGASLVRRVTIPRLDTAEAAANSSLGNFAQAHAAATAAVEKGRSAARRS